MSSMLTSMERNIGHYRGVAALPPFALFPWFFVVPGLLLAGVAGWSLRADRDGPPARNRRTALVVLAVGLLAAPAMFQMFSRAPGGERMIDDFRPFMTTSEVTRIQGYFITIGIGEAEVRRTLVPELVAAGTTPPVALTSFSDRWPSISHEMAPMIGAMSDNVGRFTGIAALPPFGLFPWFFLLPGLLVLGLVAVASRPSALDVAEERATAPVFEGA
jgi:hypothetical protein